MSHLKQEIPKHKPTLKSQHHACKICRAPHEICGRCQTAKYAGMTIPAPSTRRSRPRATLPGYR